MNTICFIIVVIDQLESSKCIDDITAIVIRKECNSSHGSDAQVQVR